jgi:hypothetical protein
MKGTPDGEMATLKVTWSLGAGVSGTDDDPENPLSRSLNRLLVDGQPLDRVVLVFFGGVEGVFRRDGQGTRLQWVGAFVLSAGGRIIFFPGYASKPTWVQSYRGSAPDRAREFVVDHISIERDLRTWHLSTRGSSHHFGKRQTCDLAQGRRFWAGVSIADDSVLRELRRKTTVAFPIPSSDSPRRIAVLRKATKSAQHLIVLLHPHAKYQFREGFVHLSFIIGPHGFPDYCEHELPLPIDPLFPKTPINQVSSLPVRSGRLSLGKVIDIQIVSSWLPGHLHVPIMLTGKST